MIHRRLRPFRRVLAALLVWLPAGPVLAAPNYSVRLLFPVLKGNELDLLLPLAPAAHLVILQGNPYIQLANFADARIAHRLGLSIQRRLALPFDLAYDPGHPQLELAMRGVLWREDEPTTPARRPASPHQSVVEGRLKPQALRPASEALAWKEPPPPKSPEPAAGPGIRQPLSPADTSLGTVANAALELGVPISRAQPAENDQIDYLYVRLRQPAEVRRLQQLFPIQQLVREGDGYLGRVGVFTRSRQGRNLMAEKLEKLRQASIQPVRLLPTPLAQAAPRTEAKTEIGSASPEVLQPLTINRDQISDMRSTP